VEEGEAEKGEAVVMVAEEAEEGGAMAVEEDMEEAGDETSSVTVDQYQSKKDKNST
jgi:hypothetical protein